MLFSEFLCNCSLEVTTGDMIWYTAQEEVEKAVLDKFAARLRADKSIDGCKEILAMKAHQNDIQSLTKT